MRKKKIKTRKKRLLFLICIIIAFVSIYLIMNNKTLKSYEQRLLEIGYTEKVIPAILQEDDLLRFALENSYIENLYEYLNTEGFMIENIEAYLEYEKNNPSASIRNIVFIVNNGITHSYSEALSQLISQKYFILSRLDRYLSYKERHQNKSIRDIVTEVNCDVDKRHYIDVSDVDITHNELMLVNKFHYLGRYIPSDLVTIEPNYTRNGGQLTRTAFEAFKRLSNTARQEGLNIVSQSAFRSYETQRYIYNNFLLQNPQSVVDTFSARPGHSEHQTGLAIDVATLTSGTLGSFVYTNEFKWMQENAHLFGFILRYPEGKEHLTGYMYEPWHWRFVGIEAATYIHQNNITFDEYHAFYIQK